MLARHGVPTTRLGALGRNDSPILEGWRIERFDAELVYRTVSASEILIIRYRRLASARGLRNPFRCFEWFHRLLREHRQETGVTFGFGIIDTRMFRADGGVDDATLTHIYRDLMGGLIVDSSEVPGLSPLERELCRRTNTRWVCQHFENYTTAREYRLQRRRAGRPVAVSGP
ncbi:MAG TPA: hypothetical protein PKA13_00430 [Geminicoccaceae bacterium]|nr:hypothetical protein [Geminicoccus sp.]HMU48204.1 hypothetical protein [Geminicoccaceae bacterium]